MSWDRIESRSTSRVVETNVTPVELTPAGANGVPTPQESQAVARLRDVIELDSPRDRGRMAELMRDRLIEEEESGNAPLPQLRIDAPANDSDAERVRIDLLDLAGESDAEARRAIS